MRSKLQLVTILAVALSLPFTSCKKSNNDEQAEFATEVAAHSEDQVSVSADIDELATDANTVLEEYQSFNGRISNINGNLCNATVTVDSISNPKKITVTYNGANCQGTRIRNGVVVFSMPANVKWKDAGAVLTINIQNLKITRTIGNKSITINGTQTVKNVTGGRLRDLAINGNITHEITSSGITITFDNNTQRSWQVAKRRVFTYNNGIVITTTGMHNDGTYANVSEWGTNRLGHPFTTVISQPMIIRQDCAFRLVSGQVSHYRLAANAVVTFGLNAAGNPTTCPATGTYFFKLVWTGANGATRTIILPY